MTNHLTNQQLLELEDSSTSHLTSCSSCELRFQHLQAFRRNLREIPEFQAPITIENKIVADLQNKAVISSKFESPLERLFLWKTGVIAMAATIFVMITISWWQMTIPPSNDNIYAALEQIIEKNNYVFSQFNQNYNQRILIFDKNLDDQLSRLESEIQMAYINNKTPQEKLRLWEQRHALLSQLKKLQPSKTQQEI